MPTYHLTAIGETMLRLSVPAGKRLKTAHQFDVSVGGAESNVLAALAQLGRDCAFGGALLDAPPGHMIAHSLHETGIDTTPIVWMQEGRIGTYYAEFAVPPRPIQVTYDRANSCTATLTADQINWAAVLNTRLLHITGITAALSPSCNDLVLEAARRAAEQNVHFSFDVNYRSKLWPPEKAAAQLAPIMAQADILFCKRQDAGTLFGIDGVIEDVLHGLRRVSPRAECIVCTDGASGVYALHQGDVLHRESVPVQIIDRMGAGDALAAGVLDGYLDNDIRRGLEYGVMLAALALSQHGDMVITTRAEVESLIRSSHDHNSPLR